MTTPFLLPDCPIQLLVSVRDADEAEKALLGGAGLIDVKEPTRGPLGRADDAVIAAVARQVQGRVPVSAALGEWHESNGHPLPQDVVFIKWGLSHCPHIPDEIQNAHNEIATAPEIVLVAYADAVNAQSPDWRQIATAAMKRPSRVLLLDTFLKDGRTLLDWIPMAELVELGLRCRKSGCRLALAGSLAAGEIALLKPARPTWFAVRGAACHDGDRLGGIDRERVRQLADLISN